MIRNEKSVVKAARRIAQLNREMDMAEAICLQRKEERDSLLKDIEDYDRAQPVPRQGGWFVTAHGHRFWPLDPRPEDIFIEDIAHSLARLCRYCGHIRATMYSVAQHSVIVSQVLQPGDALRGLLHDAPECYLGDLIKPIKNLLPQYELIEEKVDEAVCHRFGIDYNDRNQRHRVKRADLALLATEFRDVARCGAKTTENAIPALRRRIVPCSTPRAKKLFLARYAELGGEYAV